MGLLEAVCASLTSGYCLQVLHTMVLEGFDADELVRVAACVERGSSHPLAAAVVGLAASKSLALDAAVTNGLDVPGQASRSQRPMFWILGGCLRSQHAAG